MPTVQITMTNEQADLLAHYALRGINGSTMTPQHYDLVNNAIGTLQSRPPGVGSTVITGPARDEQDRAAGIALRSASIPNAAARVGDPMPTRRRTTLSHPTIDEAPPRCQRDYCRDSDAPALRRRTTLA